MRKRYKKWLKALRLWDKYEEYCYVGDFLQRHIVEYDWLISKVKKHDKKAAKWMKDEACYLESFNPCGDLRKCFTFDDSPQKHNFWCVIEGLIKPSIEIGQEEIEISDVEADIEELLERIKRTGDKQLASKLLYKAFLLMDLSARVENLVSTTSRQRIVLQKRGDVPKGTPMINIMSTTYFIVLRKKRRML